MCKVTYGIRRYWQVRSTAMQILLPSIRNYSEAGAVLARLAGAWQMYMLYMVSTTNSNSGICRQVGEGILQSV